jgi:DNA polymerase-3 subunit beta
LNRLAGLAGNVVPNKSTLPILSTLLLSADAEGINFSATDLDISIRLSGEAQVDSPGTAAIPARRFAEIVRKLDSVDVTLEEKSGALSIACGRAKFQIATMDAADFPKLPDLGELESFTVPAGKFKRMVRRTRYAASQDLARLSMNGILLEVDAEKITMVATDGHRLAYCRRQEALPVKESRSVIVPSKALDQLLRLLPDDGDLEMGMSENQAFFKTGGVQLFSRLIEGPFPNYQQVVPKQNEWEVSVSSDALFQAVDRVSTLATSLTTKQIKVIVSSDKLTLEVASPEVGKAQEELDASFNGEAMSIGYNATYLMDILKHIDSETVRFKLDRPDNAGVIEPLEQEEGEEYFSLLMPLKLSD